MQKFFYVCTHSQHASLHHCSRISFKSFSYLYEVVHPTPSLPSSDFLSSLSPHFAFTVFPTRPIPLFLSPRPLPSFPLPFPLVQLRLL